MRAAKQCVFEPLGMYHIIPLTSDYIGEIVYYRAEVT